jgi:long-chain-fatty-acid---luciferin-component ligase
VPPWLRVTARDPGDLRVLGEGESGMLGYVDPLATSYPGFVLSDDLGTVSYGVDCACGRRSDMLRIERRLSRVESRGCALKLDQVARP